MEENSADAAELRVAALMLACIYKQLIDLNAKKGYVITDTDRVTHFSTSVPPAVTLKDYLLRISQHAACSKECYIFSLIYVNRLISENSLPLILNNVHRVILVSIMLAAKFHDDRYYDNQYYARLGGISLQELNLLEAEFLYGIKFELFVGEEEFNMFESHLAVHSHSSKCTCRLCPEYVSVKASSFRSFEGYINVERSCSTPSRYFGLPSGFSSYTGLHRNCSNGVMVEPESAATEHDSVYWRFDYLG